MAKSTNTIQATGRRKNSIGSVTLVPGSGKITVNGKDINNYFGGHHRHIHLATQPLIATNNENKFDITITAIGGGITGQAGAIRLAISRALIKFDPSFKPAIKKEGMLTRDSRMVEHKKPGRPKARKRFQFSKR